ALDGLFWLGTQRIAADVQRLRQSGMVIVTREVEVSDALTGTTRLSSCCKDSRPVTTRLSSCCKDSRPVTKNDIIWIHFTVNQ
ncbi:hypothetical protein C9Z72_24390, partial [Escherichia coli]